MCQKELMSKKMLGPNKLESNKVLGQTIFWSKKIRVLKNSDKKVWLKLGQQAGAELGQAQAGLPNKFDTFGKFRTL